MITLKLTILLSTLGLCRCQWTHSITLDPLDKYHLKWFSDDSKQQITFRIVVQTRGWVGFGLSTNGGMSGSDLVIGWIDETGLTHFHVIYIYCYFMQDFIPLPYKGLICGRSL